MECKIGDIFYLDNDYIKRSSFCNENNLRIVEIEPDSNGRRFMIRELYTEKEMANIQINEIKEWFDIEYAQKEQKYRRLITLKKLCDDGSSPNDKILSLYNEAETKRKMIQSLEKIVNE